MKRYRLLFTESARGDIYQSFEWGCREWGEAASMGWARELRREITSVLGVFPLSTPLAPEGSTAPIEIRQIFVGRYRVLFTVAGRHVLILHVRGTYVEEPES
jgi:plasmid stabilization system protein ParE